MSSHRQRDAIRSCYSSWSESYFDDYLGADANYRPIHVQLIDQILTTNKAKNILDVGCGPASMIRSLVNNDRDFFGFDLTPEMIIEARKVGSSIGISPERFWVGDSADPQAYKPVTADQPTEFDAVICSGVLPHIDFDELETVFINLRNAVKLGGRVIVEARNELFSLFTLNRYARDFFFDKLIDQKNLPHSAASALERLATHFRVDLPIKRRGSGSEKGYDEITSNTHNPLILKPLFESLGFVNTSLDFYHFHRLPPMYETDFPDTYRELSEAMEDPQDWRGYFMASAFLLSGTRND